jgi:MFS superfamily sulfate permease-like transporter
MRDFSKRITSLGLFLVELALYAGFVVVYFFLVLRYLGGWVKDVFDHSKFLYAIVALTLIGAQGSLLEILTRGLLQGIRQTQAVFPALRRLARPHETVTRSSKVPGLLVYRFGGPLLFFNASHFTRRILELVDSAQPRVTFLLVNAEAIADMDIAGMDALEGLYESLENRNVTMGLCEVKGNFHKLLMNSKIPDREDFILFTSVATAVQELAKERIEGLKN